ncbi:serine/threonine protein kinase [Pelomonas sp. V22]|uniref:serine/threonine protein kinase n=1 Tax=Pelomonas sp. V22 TaxID=2822139 RepID=UPI0024A9036A|nr:serine/threonine-protein kinase [Pelomonas sp. V22]MDI4634463.1 serine/threonine protein kinase [Pelomonas sp. V22]
MTAASDDRSQIPGNSAEDDFNALPAGTRFGELEILRTLGVGGFGIVYLAQDHALERLVAIKEYMPGQLAKRSEGSHVSVRSGSLTETFDLGRRSFVNEARLLARFDHRSLLKVYRFWEANGTAYMVMPYLQGQTLKQARQQMVEPPSEAWILRRLLPLLDGLAILHAEQVYHRDIAPDNVLLPLEEADPILLDFGAARRAISDKTQSFTAILKPSYAPIEQYAEAASLRQGPWTDVYALGAVLHYLVMGHTPPPSTTRTVADEYQPLAERGLAGYSEHFLAAIDWSLGVRPQDRPQSMREFRAALLGEIKPPESTAHFDPERTIIAPRGAQAYESTQLLGGLGPTTLDTTQVTGPAAPPPPASPPPAPPEQAAPPPPVAAPREPVAAQPLPSADLIDGRRPGRSLMGLVLGLALLVGAGGWLIWGRDKGQSPPQDAASAPLLQAAASSGSAPAAAPASEPLPGKATTPASVATSPAASAPAPQVSASRTVEARTSFPSGQRQEPASKPAIKDKPGPIPSLPRQDPSLVQQPVVATHTVSTASAPASQPEPRPVEVAAAPQDPRAACSKRRSSFVPDSLNLPYMECLERSCKKAEFQAHGECTKIREMVEKRDGRIDR